MGQRIGVDLVGLWAGLWAGLWVGGWVAEWAGGTGFGIDETGDECGSDVRGLHRDGSLRRFGFDDEKAGERDCHYGPQM